MAYSTGSIYHLDNEWIRGIEYGIGSEQYLTIL